MEWLTNGAAKRFVCVSMAAEASSDGQPRIGGAAWERKRGAPDRVRGFRTSNRRQVRKPPERRVDGDYLGPSS